MFDLVISDLWWRRNDAEEGDIIARLKATDDRSRHDGPSTGMAEKIQDH